MTKYRLSFIFALLFTCTVAAQVADAPDEVKSGIPVNYTEAKVGAYTLPDPLKLADGATVTTSKAWFEKRRPEILKLFEENQFGRMPGRPADLSFEVFDKGTPAFDGKAIRRQATIYFTKDKSGHRADLLLYVPANAKGRVPILHTLGYFMHAGGHGSIPSDWQQFFKFLEMHLKPVS